MYGASTEEQVSKPSVCSSKKGKGGRREEGVALKHVSLLTTLMVVGKLQSSLRIVYVLEWEHPFQTVGQ